MEVSELIHAINGATLLFLLPLGTFYLKRWLKRL